MRPLWPRGTVEFVKSVVIDSRDDVASMNDYPTDAAYQTVVEVARCTACTDPTFTSYEWVEGMFDEPGDAFGVRRL